MSKTQKLLGLLLVILALLGTYVALKNQANRKATQSGAPALPAATVISQLPQEKIIKISLQSEQASLVFQKKAGKWQVDGLSFDLDQDQIELIAASFARLEAAEVINTAPRDLGQYGLTKPALQATAVLDDQTSGTILIGDPTPANGNYYAMVKGDPKVYAISGPDGSRFKISLNDLRTKNLAQIDFQQLNYFRLAGAGKKPIEITVNPNHASIKEDYGMSYWQLTKPYAQPLGINFDRFTKEVLPGLQGLEINEYIEDQPHDLAKYGLAQPRYELVLKDNRQQTLHLLFGKDQNEDYVYCKTPEAPSVFTINRDIFSILELTPFQLVNKLPYLINIDSVDRIMVESLVKKHTLTLSRKVKPARSKKEPAETVTTYRVNGKAVAEPVFKTFYRALIGLTLEGEKPPATTLNEAAPDVKTVFYLNSGSIREYRINYVSFNPDFYAIFHNGRSEFLISKDQVQAMLRDLEALAQGKLKARDF